MDDPIETQKEKLNQKKSRLQQQETLLKIKERKTRVRHLIAVGGLLAKAEVDHLPTDVLLGACLFIKDSLLKDKSLLAKWQKSGAEVFVATTNNKTPIILKLQDKPELSIRNTIREHGLKWNAFRKEWSGYVNDVTKLRTDLDGLKFNIDIVEMQNK